MFRGVKVIAGHGVGGEGVGFRAVLRQFLKGVALFRVEHLVFQIVGDARRGIQPLPLQTEARIHAAVAGCKKGVFAGKAGAGDHPDFQPVVQRHAVYGFAQTRVICDVPHASASFPCRK